MIGWGVSTRLITLSINLDVQRVLYGNFRPFGYDTLSPSAPVGYAWLRRSREGRERGGTDVNKKMARDARSRARRCEVSDGYLRQHEQIWN